MEAKKEIQIEELKKIQLDILLSIHNFCEENHIKYSLADGSLLGAIRHQGYIPWDDDIDICLLRDDYERLIKIFPRLYKKSIAMISLERNDQWAHPYAKAYNIHTVQEEDSLNNKPQIGIGIDIFPFDEVPDDEKEWKAYNRKRKLLISLLMLKWMKWRRGRSFGKNVIAILSKLVLFMFSFRQISFWIDGYSKKYNGKGHNHLYENCMGMILNHSFDKAAFDTTVDVSFEGYKVKAMIGYHDCLTNFYGDYMKLPPIEKRVAHHDIKAFWK